MHIKDCVSFESCVFVDIGVQECCFRIGNFSLKFDRRVMIVRLLLLFNDLFYFVSVLRSRARICCLHSVSKGALSVRFGISVS